MALKTVKDEGALKGLGLTQPQVSRLRQKENRPVRIRAVSRSKNQAVISAP